ncbi:MAG TPA: PilN domain-containing protein [Gemmatimonadales bacterium]|nr:PilN domain-containing protein [Gemmatimonadales bacterium]
MIAINLLPGAKKKRGGGAGLKLPDIKQLLGAVKDPWLLASVAGWVVVAAVVGLVYLPKRSALAELRPQLEQVERRARQLQDVLNTKQRLELRRDSLIAQMNVIREIDRQRYIWPHLMDEVARSLPPFLWLDELSSSAVNPDSGEAGPQVAFTITGKSADVQAITRFQRNLEESPFIANVNLGNVGAAPEQGRLVHIFVITGRYEEPDSGEITMQPLAASLVQGYRSGVGRRR